MTSGAAKSLTPPDGLVHMEHVAWTSGGSSKPTAVNTSAPQLWQLMLLALFMLGNIARGLG